MSSNMMMQVPADHPLIVAWTEYQKTEDFANTRKWARHPDVVEGALWAAFEAGFRRATERAADLHESVDPASDAERLAKAPGAGAMGAVIEYRDLIRQD